MTKTVVVLGFALVLVVAGAAFGVIQTMQRVATDLHRSVIALDALVVRVAAVEQDLAAISEDVYSIADDVATIADSLALEDDDEEEGEAVRLQGAAVPVRSSAPMRAERAERTRRREARRARLAHVASRRLARDRSSARVTTPQ